MKKRTIFGDKYTVVTGAYGFIGSCVVRALNDAGMAEHLIVVDDVYNDDRWLNLSGKKFSEILSREEFVKWFAAHTDEVEAVIHMGAISETDNPDREAYYKWNYRYTIDIAKRAIENNIRFIYASSAATYGDALTGFSDEHDRLDSLRPLNMYGFSKHATDLWFLRQEALDSVVGLKFFNVYGPNEYHKGHMASRVLHMRQEIAETGKARLFASAHPDYSDGEQKRDFVFVKDITALILRLLDHTATGIFNIGSGVPSTWNDLARAVFRAMDKEENIEYFEMPKKYAEKYQYYTCADMTKIESLFKDFSFTPLQEGVEDYVQNYINNGAYW